MKPKLSIIVLTHNDEKRVVDCLERLLFADELIVVDDNSTDRTLDLVKQFTKNIHIRQLNSNFSNQRNFALNLAHNDWVLFVDSDELIDQKLQEEIISRISKNNFDGYYLKRVDYVWGREIRNGEVGNVRLLRLAKKSKGKWHGKVHEVWDINGAKDELANPLIHVPHQSVSEFVDDVDRYSTLRATDLGVGHKYAWVTIVFYPLGKFIYNYFFKKGYKDGIAGLIYAVLMSFHSFLVRSKLYLTNN